MLDIPVQPYTHDCSYNSFIVTSPRNTFDEDDLTGGFEIGPEWLLQRDRSGQSYIISQSKLYIADQLNFIKSVFSLNEEELASIIGVSRKTIFNWKTNETCPDKEKTHRAFVLYVTAKNWENARFPVSSSDLSRPILAGKTVKQMLLETPLDSEKVLFAGNRLAHQRIGEVGLL